MLLTLLWLALPEYEVPYFEEVLQGWDGWWYIRRPPIAPAIHQCVVTLRSMFS